MKKSIRTKLFSGIFGLVLFFVAMSWLLNTGYLKKFYIARKEHKLVSIYQRIDKIYDGDPEQISLELEKIARTSGMSVLIFSKQLEEKYNSFPKIPEKSGNFNFPPPPERPRDDDFKKSRINRHLLLIKAKLAALKDGSYKIGIIKEGRLNSVFLYLVVRLNNQDYLWLGTPIVEIEESAAIANRFSLFTGILVLIIGSIAAYFYSKKFTGPILELNGIARCIAKLDFSRKYNVDINSDAEDELGELGKSINFLSEELGKSIRELREANLKLAEDIEQKQKIDKIRKEFVSNVSHELKTPLALIQGYAEGLKANVVESEADKDFYCNVIMDEVIRMNKLVRELLDLSQLESGSFQLEPEDFDLVELVKLALEKYKLKFKEEGVRIELEGPDAILVKADYFYIERVFFNYIDNALHHADGNKIIKITIASLAEKAKVSVFNYGKQISKEDLEQIWLSFYKADKARTRSYAGTGLGLSIVKAIMEQHHNQYGVLNHADGVEFWFELDRVSEGTRHEIGIG